MGLDSVLNLNRLPENPHASGMACRS